MWLKQLLTAGLLIFVAVSLGAAVLGVGGTGAVVPPADPVEQAPGERLIAYYFHTATRCTTCRTIEAHAREAVGPRVDAGSVAWTVVNYEDPANRHFVAEFGLFCPSVVLTQTHDGKVTRWKNLEHVWDLTDDRTAFVEYVRAELAAFEEDRP